MAEMAPSPFPIVDTELVNDASYEGTRPNLELVEPPDDRLPKLTTDEAEQLLRRGPYVARLRASKRILSIATAYAKDEQTTELIGAEYLKSLRRDVRQATKSLTRYDSEDDESGVVPTVELFSLQETTAPVLGQQALSVTTEIIMTPSQEDLVLQRERLRQQARRILIARTRPDPFEIDVRDSDATKLSKDGAEIRTDNWGTFAECRKNHPDAMFVRGAEQHKAKTLCLSCDVRRECLADALENQVEWGVWGGMTERERRALLKKRNWRSIFPSKTKSPVQPQESA